jgi:hypothetical protein
MKGSSVRKCTALISNSIFAVNSAIKARSGKELGVMELSSAKVKSGERAKR